MYLGHEGFEVFVSEEDLGLELLEALIIAAGLLVAVDRNVVRGLLHFGGICF
jgi:hypothetical protein